ncbi:MAG: DinB family protein [Rhodothermales bacterium]|nr:DinB family protein [Rhodothermales bacterium]MBO6778392.1 DinB family protein [Rhodothermales bacterium]
MSWIDDRIAELRELDATIRAEFLHLTPEQSNVKPGPRKWSINECFDHLIQTSRSYESIFEDLERGTLSLSWASRIPLLPKAMGRMVLKVVSPDYAGKNKAPTLFTPTASQFDRNLSQDLLQANADLAAHLEKCADEDLDRTTVPSPLTPFVTYSLRDCILVLVEHEKRHLNQADRVRTALAVV